MTRVRCRCCHREELHGPDGVEVVLPGGARRPDGPPEVAAAGWLAELAREGASLVDACPRCAMPRSSASPAGGRWRFEAPGVGFVGDHFELDGQPSAPEPALARIRARWPTAPASRSLTVFQLGLLAAMAAPVLFWMFMFGFWLNYAAHLAASPWLL